MASRADAVALQDIERAAAARFVAWGMAEVSAAPALNDALINSFLQRGIIYVAGQDEQLVGLAAGCMLDGAGHLAEVDVLPEHAGRRLGSQLIDKIAAWSKARGASILTLTTYAHVPWNAPYYARLGFRPLPVDELGSAHRKLWEDHRAMGLDMRQRVAMARSL